MAGVAGGVSAGELTPAAQSHHFLTLGGFVGSPSFCHFDGLRMPLKKPTDAAQFKLCMPKHAIKVYLRSIHKFFMDTVSHELGRGLERGANAISRASE
jgi:hypothetical protein